MQQPINPVSTVPEDAEEDERRENLHPAGWRNPRPGGRYNLVIIGAGQAGLAAAYAAAGQGATVALVARALFGGANLNVGGVPSKA